MQGQRITFGLHLDGQRPRPAANALGVSLVGPLGLLNILETQLGLLALRPSQAERIVQYQDCLHRLDSEQRFYHRSFATDPWAPRHACSTGGISGPCMVGMAPCPAARQCVCETWRRLKHWPQRLWRRVLVSGLRR